MSGMKVGRLDRHGDWWFSSDRRYPRHFRWWSWWLLLIDSWVRFPPLGSSDKEVLRLLFSLFLLEREWVPKVDI